MMNISLRNLNSIREFLPVNFPSELKPIEREINFTYSTGLDEGIEAINILERSCEKKDVVSIYFRDKNALEPFNSSDCMSSLDYNGTDDYIIRHNDDEHNDSMHRPENPLSCHCHIKKQRDEVNAFVKGIFQRHSKSGETHYKQYLFSKNNFKENHHQNGIVFENGSSSHNLSCKSIHEVVEVDKSSFRNIQDRVLISKSKRVKNKCAIM
ncbi:hypothetical protein [Salinisphaera sp. G21_0]|uniref:hypothetical protein n=1 Tax=Salinisphaera sp. G21_0 TaxID=2821094 RepID=UPI001ADC7793|nr:hypothetical protein [Salinisphaera sp. G21_0]MBO9484393.1 hypothetical protein [Salinisphaera sp. G21_0]